MSAAQHSACDACARVLCQHAEKDDDAKLEAKTFSDGRKDLANKNKPAVEKKTAVLKAYELAKSNDNQGAMDRIRSTRP